MRQTENLITYLAYGDQPGAFLRYLFRPKWVHWEFAVALSCKGYLLQAETKKPMASCNARVSASNEEMRSL